MTQTRDFASKVSSRIFYLAAVPHIIRSVTDAELEKLIHALDVLKHDFGFNICTGTRSDRCVVIIVLSETESVEAFARRFTTWQSSHPDWVMYDPYKVTIDNYPGLRTMLGLDPREIMTGVVASAQRYLELCSSRLHLLPII